MSAQREEAARLRALGMSLAQIGREMGLTKQRIHQIFEGNTPPRPEVPPAPKMTRKGVPIPDDAVFAAMYQEGLTDGAIARELGVDCWYVGQVRRRAGVKGRRGAPPKLSQTDLERLLDMARNGATGAEMGAEFGINLHYANRLCAKHGLKRSQGIRKRRGAL